MNSSSAVPGIWPPTLAERLAFVSRFITVALGRRGAILAAIAVVAPLLLTVADLAIASLLLLCLRSLGLTGAEPPAWLPSPLTDAGPVPVWAALLGLVATQGLLFVAGYQSRILLTEGAQLRMRFALGQRLLPQAGAPISLSQVGHLTADVFPRAANFLGHGVQLIAFALQALTLTLALLWIAPGEALLGLLGFAAAAACVVSFSRRSSRAAARAPASHLAIEQAQVRAARGWLLIRALRLQDQERARYRAASRDYYRANVETFFFANLGLGVTPLFALLVIAVTAFAREFVFGTPPAAFVAFLYLFVRFQHLLAHGSHLVGNLFAAGPQVAEATQLLNELSEHELHASVSESERFGKVPRDLGGAGCIVRTIPPPPRIEACDLDFSWPGQQRAIINGLRCEVPAGTQLGVVGPNGSGKSTFLALILGALPPDRGSLTLDGIAAAEWTTRHTGALGYVGPEPCLIAGSVRDNLTYGLDRPTTDDELLGAIEQAGFGDGFRRLPGGLDYRIGEDAAELSSGEKQKLALARSLLRQPSLLILDEPTANVDERSERDIVETLVGLRGICTIVLVSHEPRVLRCSDQILELGRSLDSPAPV